jgi:hypothetical protein
MINDWRGWRSLDRRLRGRCSKMSGTTSLKAFELATLRLTVAAHGYLIECDCLLSHWFSAPIQAIITPAALPPFATVSYPGRAQNGAQVCGLRMLAFAGVFHQAPISTAMDAAGRA